MKQPVALFEPTDFVPSLGEALAQRPLDLTKLIRCGLVTGKSEGGQMTVADTIDRHTLGLTDGKEICVWKVESLRALFRGNQQPPELGSYPKAYQGPFLLLDAHALEISRLIGPRRDEEMLETYSLLRRRPDGRSYGLVHDFMWQAAALMLGTNPLSQAEFEAILSRLERSCRTFRDGPASRNYIDALRQTFGTG